MKSNAAVRRVSYTQILVYSGLLIAISVVLKILFEVYIPLGGFPSLRINLNAIPILLGGILLGPIPGFLIGVVSDLLCFVIKPGGPLFLGFTLSSGLTGLIAGVMYKFLHKREFKSLKYFNALVSVIVVLSLAYFNVISFRDGSIYYLDDPLNPLSFVLFLALLILFAIYPFFATRILKRAEAVASENLLFIVTVEQIINSVFLNTLWLTILYGQAWIVLLPARIITNVFLIPLYTIILAGVLKILPKKYQLYK